MRAMFCSLKFSTRVIISFHCCCSWPLRWRGLRETTNKNVVFVVLTSDTFFSSSQRQKWIIRSKKYGKKICIFFWRARVCWSFLCIYRPFMIFFYFWRVSWFELKVLRSKRPRYQLSYPYPWKQNNECGNGDTCTNQKLKLIILKNVFIFYIFVVFYSFLLHSGDGDDSVPRTSENFPLFYYFFKKCNA